MKFNETYTQYWESAVHKSVDGTVIAGLKEADHFLAPLGLKQGDRLLDLGCSTGRMCAVLTQYSSAVYGVEPDVYAVGKASEQAYLEVHQGAAESTGYPDGFFDFVFCWAVFDVVRHAEGLSEINRILKDGGRFLITCKADSYDPQDVLAFKAEKNAFLKGFPNKFTNLPRLCQQIGTFGFELNDLVTFPRRGDMGLLQYQKRDVQLAASLNGPETIEGYEYLMVGKKISNPSNMTNDCSSPLEGQFSATAKVLAAQAGHVSVKTYFESIGID
jgi:SAM-dependent methyltransferase